MTIRLGDPFEPRMWARNWPWWDHHDQADFDADVAYAQGFQAGRQALAAELMPWVRWALATLPCDVALLDPAELADVRALLAGDIHQLMAHAIREQDRAAARRTADAAAEWAPDEPTAVAASEVYANEPAGPVGVPA